MIYHYTTIETLALILDSKTIRFNNLNEVDDMLEGDLFEVKKLGQYIFVSCWTKAQDENVALWKMYTHGKGVRIGLPEYPWRKIGFDEWNSKGIQIDSNPGDENYCPFTFDEIFGKNFMVIPPFFMPNHSSFAKTVVYLPNDELKGKYKNLYKETITGNNVEVSLTPEEFGKFKHNRWEFQNEFRFVLSVFPTNGKTQFHNSNDYKNISDSLLDQLRSDRTSAIKDFYVKLDVISLKDMEIMMGPLCSKADEIILNALIEKFELKNRLTKSLCSIRK